MFGVHLLTKYFKRTLHSVGRENVVLNCMSVANQGLAKLKEISGKNS